METLLNMLFNPETVPSEGSYAPGSMTAQPAKKPRPKKKKPVEAAPAPVKAAAPAVEVGAPMQALPDRAAAITRAEARRGIILAELLAPPVALRRGRGRRGF